MEEEIIGNRWKELDYVDRKPRKSTTGGLSILLTCRSSVNHFHTFPIPLPIPFHYLRSGRPKAGPYGTEPDRG